MPEALLKNTELWCLVGGADEGGGPRRAEISNSPFLIGRKCDSGFCLNCRSVSSRHAEILLDGDRIFVRDLGSTNGTYVDGQRVEGTVELREGCFVQFARLVFRVVRNTAVSNGVTAVEDGGVDQSLALIQFDKLISERRIVPYFQPIVWIEDQVVVGYEMLVRSKLFGLQNAGAIFAAARELDQECDLSRICREEAVLACIALPGQTNLFVNTHPKEVEDLDQLVGSLRELREDHPDQMVTLEIHEGAVTCPSTMRELQQLLADLNIGLAYDDFGAGQARLVELAEVPPDYLKFDMALIQGIHQAAAARQQMLATLVRMARELGIATLAEGVEEEEDSRTCCELGFELGQGYFYGRPAPVSRYADSV